MSAYLRLSGMAVVLGLSLLAPMSVYSADAAVTLTSTPTITSPTSGSTVTSSPVSVSASTTSSSVKFVLHSGTDVDSQVVATQGGSAMAELEVYGADSTADVYAYDCDDAGSCSAEPAQVSIVVDLPAPQITSPEEGAVVGDAAYVSVLAPGGAVGFFAFGGRLALDSTPPYQAAVSLGLYLDGGVRVTAVQCNADGSACNGASDELTLIKDTSGPDFLQVASGRTFYPVKDGYEDVMKMGATQRQRSVETWVEIRRDGGALIKTITLGPTRRGEVEAVWNGRRPNGDLAGEGRYEFEFFGLDEYGNRGSSTSLEFNLSHKKLVRKEVVRTVSAEASLVGNGSGRCSDLYPLDYRGSKHPWRHGVGYYSQSKCGSEGADLALGFHKFAVPDAVRYHTVEVAVYGGAAKKGSGSGLVVLYRKSGTAGATRKVGSQVTWHAGASVKASRYLARGNARWGFATMRGNQFDVKEYRLKMEVTVLQ